jgi:hypothetical protein
MSESTTPIGCSVFSATRSERPSRSFNVSREKRAPDGLDSAAKIRENVTARPILAQTMSLADGKEEKTSEDEIAPNFPIEQEADMEDAKPKIGDLSAKAVQDGQFNQAKAIRDLAQKEAKWAAAACGLGAIWEIFEIFPWLATLPIDRASGRIRVAQEAVIETDVRRNGAAPKEVRRERLAELDEKVDALADDLLGLPWSSTAQRLVLERPESLDKLAENVLARKKPEWWARWEAARIAAATVDASSGLGEKNQERADRPKAMPALTLVRGGLGWRVLDTQSSNAERLEKIHKAHAESAKRGDPNEWGEADPHERRGRKEGGGARRL